MKEIKALVSKQATMELFSSIDCTRLDISGVDWDNLNGLDSIYHKVSDISLRDTLTSYSGLENFKFLASFTSETESKYKFFKMEYLEQLHLAWSKSYASSFCSAFENLKELFIRYFSEKDLMVLGNLKKLKTLELVQGNLKSVDHLSSCNNLEHLSLSYIPSLKDLNELGQCENIKSIKLQNLPKVEKINVYGCQKLENLTIEDFKKLSTIQVASNTNLKYLKIFTANNIDNIDFIYENSQLESLFIGECKQISNLEGIRQLTQLVDYYVYVPLNNNDFEWLLHKKELKTLGLDKKNTIHDFKWLTPNHNLEKIFVCFSGEEIDWHHIFALPNIKFIHVECTKKLKLEQSYEEISMIASNFGKKIYQPNTFNSRYPFYRFNVSDINMQYHY